MRWGLGMLLGVLALPALAGVVNVDDHLGRADRVPAITVEGLAAAEVVQLRLSMQDGRGQRWQSQAALRADLQGTVDTARSGSEQGSYRGIDASGLIWSMQPQEGEPAHFPCSGSAPMTAWGSSHRPSNWRWSVQDRWSHGGP